MLYEIVHSILTQGDSPPASGLHFVLLPADQSITVDLALVPSGGDGTRALGSGDDVVRAYECRITARAAKENRHQLFRTLMEVRAQIRAAGGMHPADIAAAPYDTWEKKTGAAAEPEHVNFCECGLPSYIGQDQLGRQMAEVRAIIGVDG